MNTHSTILDNDSVEATTLNRILQAALAGQGNIREAVDQFNDQFTFTDNALGLEFKDKGRSTEFLAKIRELFPDSERKAPTPSSARFISHILGVFASSADVAKGGDGATCPPKSGVSRTTEEVCLA
jgi:hypothetical protein